MSEVRWCDRHQGPFSVLEDGWETYTASKMVVNADTQQRTTTSYQADACATCASVTSPLTPRTAIAATEAVQARYEGMSQRTRTGRGRQGNGRA